MEAATVDMRRDDWMAVVSIMVGIRDRRDSGSERDERLALKGWRDEISGHGVYNDLKLRRNKKRTNIMPQLYYETFQNIELYRLIHDG